MRIKYIILDEFDLRQYTIFQLQLFNELIFIL